jgi:hypothetical protein
MMVADQKRSNVRQRLQRMDFHPWHRCYGLDVWRNHIREWWFSVNGQIVSKEHGIDAAVAFVMANGWEDQP